MLTSHHRNKSLRRAEDLNFYDIFIQLRLRMHKHAKNKQDKCESLNRVKKVLPSLAPFQLGIFSNVAGSPHGDVVFDWVVNCVTAIAQGLVDGKIPASQQIYNAICERTIISSACAEYCTERPVALIGVRAQRGNSMRKGHMHRY